MKWLAFSAIAAVGTTLASAAGAQYYDAGYMGQVIIMGANYCPRGSIVADGQVLPIAPNTALFSLYGTSYGGDGVSTFAVPDLRAKQEDGQPIPYGQPGSGLLHCVISEGVYPPRD
jgi:microcystin-dependent protein